jgi:hypothetical protein
VAARGERGTDDPSRATGDDLAVRDDDTGMRRTIVCAACGHVITATDARIAARGEHEHVCVNPSGIPYRIGCFRDAPGCVPHGDEESLFSWFPGYRWQIALCGACRAHLGWSFHGNGTFYGLVVARLRVAGD